MELKDLKEVVPKEQHKELDTLIEGIQVAANPLTGITDEVFNEQLKGNEDFKKVLDKRIQTGIEGWKKNNLEKHVNDEYEKRYAVEHPDETDEQKRIKVLEVKGAEDTARADRAELKSAAIELMTEKKLPKELLDMAIGNDLETTTARINAITEIFEARDKTTSERILKENGRVITVPEDNAAKYFTAEQIESMSPNEQFDNKDKVDASMNFLALQQ